MIPAARLRRIFSRMAVLLALGAASARALIFPLLPGPDGSYDYNYNVLRGFSAIWATNHHAIYNVGADNAVAIAPRWFLTAWHVARQLDEQSWFNDDTARYYFREAVNLENDLALVRVDKPVPFYSKLQKLAGGTGDILTVYGQSGAPLEPILNLAANRKVGNLRRSRITSRCAGAAGAGSLRQRARSSGNLPRATRLGNGGLNCAAVNTNDSGGGIFFGDEVAGVITGFSRRASVTPLTSRRSQPAASITIKATFLIPRPFTAAPTTITPSRGLTAHRCILHWRRFLHISVRLNVSMRAGRASRTPAWLARRGLRLVLRLYRPLFGPDQSQRRFRSCSARRV